jgi:hypothetical protein
MKYLMASTLFGTIGWLVSAAVLDYTGNTVLAALGFGLTVAGMIWGFDLRRRLDD